MEFTAIQRMSVESILGQQRGTVGELEVVYDIIEKIKLPTETKNSAVKTLPDGRVLLDEVALQAIPNEDITLEKAERQKLLDIIKTYNGFGPGDVSWIMPLKKQLEH